MFNNEPYMELFKAVFALLYKKEVISFNEYQLINNTLTTDKTIEETAAVINGIANPKKRGE